MYVYVVNDNNYMGGYIIGVFAKRPDAEKAVFNEILPYDTLANNITKDLDKNKYADRFIYKCKVKE